MQHFFCERCRSSFSSGPELERHIANQKISGCPLTDEDATVVIKTFMRLSLENQLSEIELVPFGRIVSMAISDQQEGLIKPAIEEALQEHRTRKKAS